MHCAAASPADAIGFAEEFGHDAARVGTLGKSVAVAAVR